VLLLLRRRRAYRSADKRDRALTVLLEQLEKKKLAATKQR